jgi:hypothetical protein
MPLRVVACLILGLVLTGTSARAAEDLRASVPLGKKLLAEGDSLADRNETTEAQLRYKQAFEQLLPSMRKLKFRHEVKREVTNRDDLRAFLIKEIDEEKSPAEFRAEELGMKALGLVPRDFDLKETMLRVLTEQIAAFYDPKTKTMHLIKEPKATRPLTLVERLVGRTTGFDKEENKTVIAHELTHALTDQHFDIEALQHAFKKDDDRDLALSALIEGDASLTMLAAQAQDWDGSTITRMRADRLDATFRMIGPLMMLGSGPNLRAAPPIVSETLVFPYLRGLVFCAHLTNQGGWSALDAAYRDPPLSTEQVIHPAKYRDHPDPPTAIDLGRLEPGEGWKEAGRNVVGELQLSVLLRRHNGPAAAEGWDGDEFAVFEGPKDRLGLVWLTTWDTDRDAREFVRSYLLFQTTKLGAGVPDPDAFPDATRRPHHGAVFALERRGRDVAVVEGFPSARTETLIEAALRAQKTEQTRATSQKKPPTEKAAGP